MNQNDDKFSKDLAPWFECFEHSFGHYSLLGGSKIYLHSLSENCLPINWYETSQLSDSIQIARIAAYLLTRWEDDVNLTWNQIRGKYHWFCSFIDFTKFFIYIVFLITNDIVVKNLRNQDLLIVKNPLLAAKIMRYQYQELFQWYEWAHFDPFDHQKNWKLPQDLTLLSSKDPKRCWLFQVRYDCSKSHFLN